MSLNVCVFGGNLTRDVEVVPVGETRVAKFAIAINRRIGQKEEVHFQECEAWDTGADHVARFFRKGDGIIVKGTMRTDSWDDKNGGGRRSRAVLRVEHSYFPPKSPTRGESREEPESQAESAAPLPPSPPARATPPAKSSKPAKSDKASKVAVDGSDDIPF